MAFITIGFLPCQASQNYFGGESVYLRNTLG